MGEARLLPWLVLLAAAGAGRGQTLAFTASLDGNQVVPPSGSTGVGTASFVLDRNANTLRYHLTVRNLTGAITGVDLHGFAPSGQSAPALHTLGATATSAGTRVLSEAEETQLVAGLAYVDVHTSAFAAGEIRGQLVRRPDDAVLGTELDSAQVPSGSNSPAAGTGFFRIDTAANRLRFDLTLYGLTSNELMTHIHRGPPGQEGPILFIFPSGNKKVGKWDYPESEEADLLSGNTYVNVHTQGFLSGEIRGQILPLATNPSAYCTAKVGSLGCSPAIGWTGTPELGGADDLFVTGSQVLSGTSGLFYFGLTPKQTPFFGGTQCARGPLQRTPVQPSGGNPPPADCSGSFSFHLSHAYLAAKGLGPGTLLHGQWWWLDPNHPDGTGVGLSDAVLIELRP